MFKLFYKPKQQYIKVYNVRNDKHGYPQFLIFDGGQWLYISAKHFTEDVERVTE